MELSLMTTIILSQLLIRGVSILLDINSSQNTNGLARSILLDSVRHRILQPKDAGKYIIP